MFPEIQAATIGEPNTPTHVGEPNIVIILYDNKDKVGVAEGRGHAPIGRGRVGFADTCRGQPLCPHLRWGTAAYGGA
jgi:hypothetical protein